MGVAAKPTRFGSARRHADATYIVGISGKTVAGGVSVMIDSNNRLGTSDIVAALQGEHPADGKASEAILSLQPVTFRYKNELDPQCIPQFGLLAEQVAKVDSDLVARDQQGKPYTRALRSGQRHAAQ